MKQSPNTQAVIEVFDLIMGLAGIYRHNTMPFDAARHENVAEHSYGLATLACSLAASMNETVLAASPLDIGKIAQLALVHDLPEALMQLGDVSVYAEKTLLKAKLADEAEARQQLTQQTQAFPWLAATVQTYEARETPAARFVYALDKLIVHLIVILNGEHHAKPTYARYLETETVARRKISDAFPELLPYFEDLCLLLKARPHLFTPS